MGVLTQDMRDILASAMLAFVATVRRDGSPSLSPKASTIPYDDDHLLFVDMASPQTVANLRNDPRIEINSVDFVSADDGEIIEMSQQGFQNAPDSSALVMMGGREIAPTDHMVTETAIRGMYKYWREVMGYERATS